MTKTKAKAKLTYHYVIRVGRTLFIERFSYPQSTTKRDPAWEKLEGIRVAACLKAHLGKKAFGWWNKESADSLAERIPNAKVVKRRGDVPKAER